MAGPAVFTQEWCRLVQPWLNADATYRQTMKGCDLRMWLIMVKCPGDVDRFLEHRWKDGELVTFKVEEKPYPAVEWHTIKFDESTEKDPEWVKYAFTAPVHPYQRTKNWWGGARGTYHVMCDLHCPTGDPPRPLIPLGMPYPKFNAPHALQKDRKTNDLSDQLHPAYLDARFKLDQRGFEADARMKHLQGHFDACARANRHFDVQFPGHLPRGGPATFFEVYQHGRAKGELGPLAFTQEYYDEYSIAANYIPENLAVQKKYRRWALCWNFTLGRPDGYDAVVEHDWRDGMDTSQIVWAKPAPAADWRKAKYDKKMRWGGATHSYNCTCDLWGPTDEALRTGIPKFETRELLLEAFSDPRFLLNQSANEGYYSMDWLDAQITVGAWTRAYFNSNYLNWTPKGGPTIAEIMMALE